MGLAEKRLAKRLQDEVIPAFQAELNAIVGYEPTLEIDWDTFTAFDEYPMTRLEGSVLPQLIEVAKSICRDDMGKEALKGAMQKIHLVNTDNDNDVELRFAEGVLYHKMQLAGSTYRYYSTDQIIALLEKSL